MNGSYKSVIHVTTFGEFSMEFNGHRISDADDHSKKPWLLLEYLILFRNREISPEELSEAVWGSRDSTNPAGALKTLMHRTRKLLEPLEYPPRQLIPHRCGSYAWTKEPETSVDIDLFENLAAAALDTSEDPDNRLECCLEALDLYRGDFLAGSGCQSWIIPLSAYYRNMCRRLLLLTVSLLTEREDYPRIIGICEKGLTIFPHDEELLYSLIFSLYRCGRQTEALDRYTKGTERLYRDLGITPSADLRSLYQIICSASHEMNMDLKLIEESFMEEALEEGACFCELPVFRDIYRLEQRSSGRSDYPVHLCLVTLTDPHGNPLRPQLLKNQEEILASVIRSSLRAGDVYSACNASQYVILLPTSAPENCRPVMERIVRTFHDVCSQDDVRVTYSIQSSLSQ